MHLQATGAREGGGQQFSGGCVWRLHLQHHLTKWHPSCRFSEIQLGFAMSNVLHFPTYFEVVTNAVSLAHLEEHTILNHWQVRVVQSRAHHRAAVFVGRLLKRDETRIACSTKLAGKGREAMQCSWPSSVWPGKKHVCADKTAKAICCAFEAKTR